MDIETVKEKFFKDGFVSFKADVSPETLRQYANVFGKLLRVGKHHIEGDNQVQIISQNELFATTEVPWHNDFSYSVGEFHGSILGYLHSDAPTWTEFCDCNAAYDALPDDQKEYLETVIGWYTPPGDFSHLVSDVQLRIIKKSNMHRPLIMEHPVTKQKSLYLSASTLRSWDKPIDKEALIEHCEKFTFKHNWEPGDIILWDNRRMMHRRPAFKGRRELLRINFGYV